MRAELQGVWGKGDILKEECLKRGKGDDYTV